MRFGILTAQVLGLLVLNSGVDAADVCKRQPSVRPVLVAAPHRPAIPHFQSPKRTKVCYVSAFGNGKDDSPSIFSAAKACNNGGTVVLAEPLYIIGKPLDLTFLNAIDFDFQGTVRFTDDTDFWMKNSFKYAFQDGSAFWQWGGNDVNFYGGGTFGKENNPSLRSETLTKSIRW